MLSQGTISVASLAIFVAALIFSLFLNPSIHQDFSFYSKIDCDGCPGSWRQSVRRSIILRSVSVNSLSPTSVTCFFGGGGLRHGISLFIYVLVLVSTPVVFLFYSLETPPPSPLYRHRKRVSHVCHGHRPVSNPCSCSLPTLSQTTAQVLDRTQCHHDTVSTDDDRTRALQAGADAAGFPHARQLGGFWESGRALARRWPGAVRIRVLKVLSKPVNANRVFAFCSDEELCHDRAGGHCGDQSSGTFRRMHPKVLCCSILSVTIVSASFFTFFYIGIHAQPSRPNRVVANNISFFLYNVV